jgi:hypothetical protein
VSRVFNTTVDNTPHADFGMPGSVTGSARLRVAQVRDLPVMTGVDFAGAQDTCALIVDIDGSDYRSAMTDVAAKGVFPGTSAWRPPN